MSKWRLRLLRLVTYIFNLPEARERLEALSHEDDVDPFNHVYEDLGRTFDGPIDVYKVGGAGGAGGSNGVGGGGAGGSNPIWVEFKNKEK